MSKKKKTNESEPPSLFDKLDLFAPMVKADEKSGEKGESKEAPPEKKSEPAKKESAPPPPSHVAATTAQGAGLDMFRRFA